jgi:phosphatidylserine/phosphatidylglycerophosphate/cardiolipin synthase-like enzyme
MLSISVALAVGCATITPEPGAPVATSDVARQATAGPLAVSSATVLTDNDAAFQSKLKLVEGATSSLDLIYYIYGDDYSSSVFSQALVAAARRGVRVRLLVDYHTNYKRLDLFTLLERRGAEGPGRIEVRFYNRPTRSLLQDVAYMTMGCGRNPLPGQTTPPAGCSAEKFAAVDRLFAEEKIDGEPAALRNISNVNTGASGLFLSGLYSKRPDVMALAIQRGQQFDVGALKASAAGGSPQDMENLKRVGKLYWEARTGSPFKRLEAQVQLLFMSSLYGEQLSPVRNTFYGALPAQRKTSAESLRDWDHLTDFTHHKLLLADGASFQLGGRNVEDSYHMRGNPLVHKYVFMDTDLVATLTDGGRQLTESFDNLWQFRDMVATLSEVRTHAPNDFVANLEAYGAAQKSCARAGAAAAREKCIDDAFRRGVRTLDERVAQRAKELDVRAAKYRTDYKPGTSDAATAVFAVDASAELFYLENLHFNRALSLSERHRLYGAESGREGASGKHIHDVWLQSLRSICAASTRESPQQVILHNAYFFPPGNLSAALAELWDGRRDCSNVTVRVLTNSIETTDLSVVNLFSRHSIKAFVEHYVARSDPKRRAKFEYYEYQAPKGGRVLSLHSKVSVFGETVVIGSANADVRSFMMDSNNAMLLRRAPDFASAYRAHVERMLGEGRALAERGQYFAHASRAQMVTEDVASLRAMMNRYGVSKRLDAQQLATVEARFVELLDYSYALTRDAIDPAATPEQRRAAQNKLNDLFKSI